MSGRCHQLLEQPLAALLRSCLELLCVREPVTRCGDAFKDGLSGSEGGGSWGRLGRQRSFNAASMDLGGDSARVVLVTSGGRSGAMRSSGRASCGRASYFLSGVNNHATSSESLHLLVVDLGPLVGGGTQSKRLRCRRREGVQRHDTRESVSIHTGLDLPFTR